MKPKEMKKKYFTGNMIQDIALEIKMSLESNEKIDILDIL
jgi:hypothetical protein